MADRPNDFNELFAWGMSLEDELHADGKLNEYSYRGRELTDFICRSGTIIETDGRPHMVLKVNLDQKTKNGDALVLPAGFDLREAALRYLNECKPHWQVAEPVAIDGLASAAFGLDGQKVTLAAQARFVKEECGGDAVLANAKAKEFGARLGSLTPGKRPATDKTKAAPALDAVRKNPWLLPNDSPEAINKRVGIIRDLGTSVAAGLAKAAGKTLGGAELRQ